MTKNLEDNKKALQDGMKIWMKDRIFYNKCHGKIGLRGMKEKHLSRDETSGGAFMRGN